MALNRDGCSTCQLKGKRRDGLVYKGKSKTNRADVGGGE